MHILCALRTGSQSGRLHLLAAEIEDCGMRSVERDKFWRKDVLCQDSRFFFLVFAKDGGSR